MRRWPEPAEGIELRFSIRETDFRAYGEEVIRELEQYAHKQGWEVADDSREGVRISFGPADGDGWLLLRLSVHDPVMPLNIESDRRGGCRQIAERLAPFIACQGGLDASALEQYLEK